MGNVYFTPSADYIADWDGRLKSKLYVQFRDKPHWLAIAALIARQTQDAEDALESMYGLPSIANGQGVQLDILGALIGQRRAGQDDPTYKLYLAARRAANRSEGAPEEIYAVMRALIPGVSQIYFPGGTKQFRIQLRTAISAAQAAAALGFLDDSKDAGDRGWLEWQEQGDADVFSFATAQTLSHPVIAGDLFVQIDDPAGWPASGSVTLDRDLAAAETHAYTSIAGHDLVLATPLVNGHATGSLAELVGDQGQGWGDSADPTTGGDWAGAGVV